MLRHDREVKHGRLYRASERAFNWMRDTYGTALRWVLEHEMADARRHRRHHRLHRLSLHRDSEGPLSAAGHGLAAGGSQAPQDISFPAMKARTEALNAVVAQDPNIEHFVSFIGQGNTGFFFIQLKAWGVRKLTADQVIGELRPKLAAVPASASSCKTYRTCAWAGGFPAAVPVTRWWTEPRRADAVGAARAGEAALASAAARREYRPADERTAPGRDGGSRHRGRGSASPRRRSTRPSTTRSGSARSPPCTRS